MKKQFSDRFEYLQYFSEFCKKVENQFCDFEEIQDGQKILTSLLKSEVTSYFTVIGMQKSSSLICFWKYKDNISLQEQPIVWLDSEGSPNAVIASNFKDFLSLLPYDTGAIYDWIAAWERYLDNSTEQEIPTERFTIDRINRYLAMSDESNPCHQEFVNWLRTEMHIELADRPVALIGNAIESFPRLSQWLNR
jgi:hypothetical protein